MLLGWVLVMLGGVCLAAINLVLAAMVAAINECRAPQEHIQSGFTGGTFMSRVTAAYRRECPNGRLHWGIRGLMVVGFALGFSGWWRLAFHG